MRNLMLLLVAATVVCVASLASALAPTSFVVHETFLSAHWQDATTEAKQRFVDQASQEAIRDIPDVQVLAADLLIHRIIPNHDKDFVLSLIPLANGTEHVFEVESNSTAIFLRGSSGVALSSAFNYYLKYVCNASLSWSGDQLNIPTTLPRVPAKVRSVSLFEWNYYMNVCTVSYSSVWWEFARWEREIDWMALNGVTMPLAFTGQEYVWRRLFHLFNLTDSDLSPFFAGPAFLAWGRMGNIKGWGGPISLEWIYKQRNLQVLILQRMRTFGMTPVLPSFAGHVPSALAQHFPNANITQSSDWNNFPDQYCCVGFLDASDPLFTQIGAEFLRLQNETYGTNHLYNCDQFNEMTPASTDLGYLKQAGMAVYQSMTAYDPAAVWVMQGWLFFNEAAWWSNDRVQALLSGVPDDHMIILDLFSDVTPVWNRLESYYGKPFIWNMLHDFGGNIGLYGILPSINEGPFAALATPGNTMVGIGLTPEGINQNYILYEFMMENMWRSAPVNLPTWVDAFVGRRYGPSTPAVAKLAYQQLLQSVYNCTNGQYSVTKSLLEIRPAVNMSRNGFMPTNLYYDPGHVILAVDHILAAAKSAPQLASVVPFRYDVVDFTRQMLSNLAIDFHSNLTLALTSKQAHLVHLYGQGIVGLIADLDELLVSDAHFLLGPWLAAARSWSENTAAQDLLEFNARNQITLWGPNGEITDYASKQWAGLMSSYYRPRWELFVSFASAAAESDLPFNDAAFNAAVLEVEKAWQHSHHNFTVTPLGDSIAIATRLRAKYDAVLRASTRML
ncbi:lysosomal alpha-N-acetyl glucosaminidase [Capsaspora owczarzaki ATCC 30864]|uniref:Lysosomal alpha-N-acetyl glucosaminidase n=1 Tax=Capsaspora owczarzaki (strain ATCC 30864) TaxID=595528 RepID=A0A0D2U0H7_CAPO3|nr:lysosomal alpha-N-acetyl glucosaminidase [Capsaspora owczarzaki ATCC 30864]KJE88736.1 lysosomal alpha-N-acetyl glucosaminidase [Capsaspora owczarzaki ATCC 30864]|eukprot:XP_004365200.1 lysosomal alpha-N-acetyl glucosaminidase [Capsaspora owczarzaki ATCC 30864]